MSQPPEQKLLASFVKLNNQNRLDTQPTRGSCCDSGGGNIVRSLSGSRNGRLPAVVAILSCALLGHQTALFSRRKTFSSDKERSQMTEPRLISMDDDSVAAAMPAWSMPWFSSSSSSSPSSSSSLSSIGSAISGAGEGIDDGSGDDYASSSSVIFAATSHSQEGWEARALFNAASSSDTVASGSSTTVFALLEKADASEDDMTMPPRATETISSERGNRDLKSADDFITTDDSVEQLTRQERVSLTQEHFLTSKVAAATIKMVQDEADLALPRAIPRNDKLGVTAALVSSWDGSANHAFHFLVDDVSPSTSKGRIAVGTKTTGDRGTADYSLPSRLAVAQAFDALVAASVERQRSNELASSRAKVEAGLGSVTGSAPTIAPAEKKRPGIAFLKTHKCGSSTLGSIFFRYAARHRQRMPFVHHNIAASFELRTNITTCDIALQHIQVLKFNSTQPMPQPQLSTFECPVKLANGVLHLNGNIRNLTIAAIEYTRAVASPVFVTVLREPLSHYASWAHFYKLPETSVQTKAGRDQAAETRPLTLDEFVLSSGARKNPMAHSIGLYRSDQLQGFVETFSLILLMDRFDEGLILLRRLLNWDLVDLTYFRINDSHLKLRTSSSEGLKRSWDGLPVLPSPKVHQMSNTTRQRIETLTSALDKPLYDMASQKFEHQMDAAGVASLSKELIQFQRLQAALDGLCTKAVESSGRQELTRADFSDGGGWTSYLRDGWKKQQREQQQLQQQLQGISREAPPSDSFSTSIDYAWGCRWYALSDLQYEKQITPSGLAPIVPFSDNKPFYF